MVDAKTLLESILPVIRSTSSFIHSQIDKVSSNDIEEKEKNSLVSYVDKEAEKQLVEGLKAILPESGFITEEDTRNSEGREYTWIIDPLDGTTNFLNRVPHFAISVALRHRDSTILGVVKEVNSGEEWTAVLGEGAFLNGKKITVNQKPFHDILVATGFPYSNDFDHDTYLKILKSWLTETRGIRRFGSAALDLCYVACGRYGAYYEATLNPWELAAGALIVQEAGGVVSDFSQGDNYLFGREIIASNKIVYPSVFNTIASKLNRGN